MAQQDAIMDEEGLWSEKLKQQMKVEAGGKFWVFDDDIVYELICNVI